MADEFEAKTITCVECSQDFEWSVGEQKKFQELGYTNEPKRCKPCRDAKKMRQGGGERRGGPRGGGPREFTEAVCAECGKTCQVPFKPRGDRPVYCSDCFQKHRR